MPKSKKGSKKRTPQRTCVACREVLDKRSLIRVVRLSGAVKVDLTGKLPGRGAYLHDRLSCWQRGMDGVLERALRTELTAKDLEELSAYMSNLPGETPVEGEGQGE